MRYVLSRYAEMQKEECYRIYITDTLYLHGENKRLSNRYIEYTKPKKVDNRTGDEIAADVINRLGLSFIEKGNTE